VFHRKCTILNLVYIQGIFFAIVSVHISPVSLLNTIPNGIEYFFLRLLVPKLWRQMLGELEIQLVWIYCIGIWPNVKPLWSYFAEREFKIISSIPRVGHFLWDTLYILCIWVLMSMWYKKCTVRRGPILLIFNKVNSSD